MGFIDKEISIKLFPLLIIMVVAVVCAGEAINGSNFSAGSIPPQLGGRIMCLERERQALLTFKKSLIDNDYGSLSSWGREDRKKECCSWYGVKCSNTTGHVTGLTFYDISGEISSALLELHHLNKISFFNFGGNNRIPEFIGSIKSLQHLELDSSNFSGIIPPQLGNLTNLLTLNLGGNHLWSDSLDWLPGLSFLTQLDLSDCNISDAKWLQHVLQLPSLQKLYLSGCALTDHANLFVNSSSTSLSTLNLGDNKLASSTFDWLFNISTSFVLIDLSSNELDGPIPYDFGKLIHLKTLDLSYNMLEGGIPKSFGNLIHLKYLDLSSNMLEGGIPKSFGNLIQLEELYLSRNLLGETLEEIIGNLSCKVMGRLELSNNQLTGSLPDLSSKCTQLTFLDLGQNKLTGSVPANIGQLSNLYNLDLSHNQMSGTIPDLSSISIFEIDISSNKFSGPLPLLNNEIRVVQFSQNRFSGSNISSSICTLPFSSLRLIDLSNNQLSGALPNCWDNMPSLEVLNMNNNNLSSEIPHSLGYLQNLQSLHLGRNNLFGEMPSTLKNCRALQLIDVGGNKLNGNITTWLGGDYANLTYLSLRGNRFYGGIPQEICKLTRIQMLDLSGNNLSGEIPQCFNNFTSLVDKNSTIAATIRIVFGYNDYIDYTLVQWKRVEQEYKNTLGLLKLIDLSSNKLVGSIPEAFSNLRGLISLNLSRNSLIGNMDPNIGEMEMLECLDLSRNQLSGRIPIGLAQLTFLNVLDLANNNLSGKIPLSTQLQSFNESVFGGNSNLCGKPLLNLCPEDLTPPIGGAEDNNEEESNGVLNLSSLQEFCISLAFGFIVGFWGVVGSLIVKKSWRSAFFNLFDAGRDWLYVTTTIFVNKLR